MKFEIKDTKHGGINIFTKDYHYLIRIGNILLMKENCKQNSCCWENVYLFDYHGIEKAICGKQYFTPKRFLVIQMK